MRIFRLAKIFSVAFRSGLDDIVLAYSPWAWVQPCMRKVFFFRKLEQSRGVRLRIALERLGPIFVKFGQVLSTRRDLLPIDIADELAKLQDRVPPFDSRLAIAQIEASLGKHPNQLFAAFSEQPVASASIAQVHRATLKTGQLVAVKVLRPNMRKVIEGDLALMRVAASLVERFLPDGKRLRPKEIVDEFDKYLHEELDLIHEAANASQLRRNFSDSKLLRIPEIYWDYCRDNVMVMEWMEGISISQLDTLRNHGVDIPKLARDGVEIFFTQVFRDGFFHADMHPGNIFVSTDPKTLGQYIALDFGIVGTLTDVDKNYLAQNFLAFFRRDYKRVAEAHVECGWVPKDTRIDELESAIRSCCEPIFDRPLKEISFGHVLLRLFQMSRRFHVNIQPQLVMLQKTLLNIEGLGREIDPDLDLWKTAKPFLERWMSEQMGVRGLLRHLRDEAPRWGELLPQIPRLSHQWLNAEINAHEQRDALTLQLQNLTQAQQKTQRLLGITLCGLLLVMVVLGCELYWQQGLFILH